MKAKPLLPVMLLATLTACGGAVGVVHIPPPPPRPAVRMTRAPGPNYIWTDGHWDLRGNRWVWVEGRWLVPPRSRAVWVPGHWERRGHRWHFHRGYWR